MKRAHIAAAASTGTATTVAVERIDNDAINTAAAVTGTDSADGAGHSALVKHALRVLSLEEADRVCVGGVPWGDTFRDVNHPCPTTFIGLAHGLAQRRTPVN